MITIVLPGYSAKNKEWALEVKEKLDLKHDVVVHEWKHWTEGSFSVKVEKEIILSKIGNTNVNIVAKSVGTRITMHLIPKILDQLNKVVLCGIPTKFESKNPRNLYRQGLSLLIPTQLLVIQNERDPLANYLVINNFVYSVNPKIKVIKKKRSDHHYPHYEDIQDFLYH